MSPVREFSLYEISIKCSSIILVSPTLRYSTSSLIKLFLSGRDLENWFSSSIIHGISETSARLILIDIGIIFEVKWSFVYLNYRREESNGS